MKKKQQTIANQVREAVQHSKLSWYRISRMSGVDDRVLSKFMKDESDTRISTIQAIIDALELDVIIRSMSQK